MREQNWTLGSRYVIPTNELLKSGEAIFNVTDFHKTLVKGGDMKLAETIELISIPSEVINKVSIDLNNNNIVGGIFTESGGSVVEGTSDSYAFWVKEEGDLTIEGDGEVIAQEATYSMAVWANGGDVTIKGGTFRNGGDGTDLIYASNGGNVYIYGGEFIGAGNTGSEPGTKNKFSLLNVKDKDYKSGISNIIVYGGKFHGFNPADNLSEGKNTNFVADGYKSIEVEEGIWEVVKE